MKGMTMKVTGNKLTIDIDLSKKLGASKSGKSQTIASTEGNVDVPGKPGVKIGLNVYEKI